jgi:Na+/H+ antiporter NhaB
VKFVSLLVFFFASVTVIIKQEGKNAKPTLKTVFENENENKLFS